MFHLRLCKALSYMGAVSATKDKPDVYTEDEAAAMQALRSGYFVLCQPPVQADAPEDARDEDAAEQFAGESEPAYGGKTLEDMTAAELETFATYKNVSLKGIRGKAKIIAKLREVLGEAETSGIIEYGSPTMTELQDQIN